MTEQEAYDAEHRALRELLGAFLLGGLSAQESLGVQAHLDGCAACRAELADLADLVPALRAVDPDRLGDPVVSPTGDLGGRILRAASAERELLDRRRRAVLRRRTVLRSLSAAAAAAAVLALGVGVGRQTVGTPVALPQPSPSPTAVVPMEPVSLRSDVPGVAVEQAILVPHTWGVEVRFVATGFLQGADYSAWVVDRTGGRTQAGTFVGVGAKALKCNMQSALLRRDATEFLVLDTRGRTVLDATLPAVPLSG